MVLTYPGCRPTDALRLYPSNLIRLIPARGSVGKGAYSQSGKAAQEKE